MPAGDVGSGPVRRNLWHRPGGISRLRHHLRVVIFTLVPRKERPPDRRRMVRVLRPTSRIAPAGAGCMTTTAASHASRREVSADTHSPSPSSRAAWPAIRGEEVAATGRPPASGHPRLADLAALDDVSRGNLRCACRRVGRGLLGNPRCPRFRVARRFRGNVRCGRLRVGLERLRLDVQHDLIAVTRRHTVTSAGIWRGVAGTGALEAFPEDRRT